jgi:simple sugar transport system permease protein
VTTSRRARSALGLVFALAGVVLVLNLIAFAFGQAPAATLRRALEGTWGTPYGIGQVLFKASPLLCTGLAFEVALRAGLFNIGAEGQLALASLVGGAFAAKLPAGTPWPVAVLAALVVGAGVGALVALPPAVMRARLGVHEIITGIMMNRVVDVLVPWALTVVVGSSSLRTADIAPAAAMMRLDRLLPSLAGSAASAAFPLAVAVVYAAHALLARTRAGREMRFIGLNAAACRAEGVAVPRRLLQAMLLSGALAGLGMTSTVLGYKGYYELGLGAGAGFSGIAVAMLGRGSPTGLVLAALLFGTLEQAGLAINAHVPKEAMNVLEAVVIVLVAIGARASRAPAASLAAPVEPTPAPTPEASA